MGGDDWAVGRELYGSTDGDQPEARLADLVAEDRPVRMADGERVLIGLA